MRKLQSGWGSAPDPDGGAYSAPPYPLAGVGVSLAALTFPPSLPNPGSAPAFLITFVEKHVIKLFYLPLISPRPLSYARACMQCLQSVIYHFSAHVHAIVLAWLTHSYAHVHSLDHCVLGPAHRRMAYSDTTHPLTYSTLAHTSYTCGKQ